MQVGTSQRPLVVVPCRFMQFGVLLVLMMMAVHSSKNLPVADAADVADAAPEISHPSNRLPGPFIRINSGDVTIVSRKTGLGARFILRPAEVRFAFGFFTASPGTFALAVYLYPFRNARHRRRVWCATDENHVPILVQNNASLQLDPSRGLVLFDAQGKQVWSAAATRKNRGGLELREDGNLVLYDGEDRSVWDSFSDPVDVLLPGQTLTSGMKLVNGPYKLAMEANGLVLYLETSRIWTWDICSNKTLLGCSRPTYAQFTTSGLHLVHGTANASLEKPCQCNPGSYDPIRVLTGHAALALLLSNNGALHVDVLCSGNASLRSKAQRLLSRRHLSTGGNPCSICIHNSNCHCSDIISAEHVRSLLSNSERTTDNSVHSRGHWSEGLSIGPGRSLLSNLSIRRHLSTSLKYKATVAFAGLLGAAALAILAALCVEKKAPKKPQKEPIKDILPSVIPHKFSYSSLKKITDNFNKLLGDGGFGGVYEGVLKDGSKVAVKVLEQTSTQGEKEFKAEMTTMASIRHMNILQLRGYCAEKKHRVLVYDFMPNGSLDKWLFSPPGKDGILDWAKRFSIAVGTARGLAYLHEECNQQIIHLDVKPENILLDNSFTAKVADFGLSKLIDRDKSKVVTNMRGTPGYLAPEWMHHSSVTTKADVYSFGMVLLELICGRETIDLTKGSEQWYLPAWAVRMVEEGRTLELVDDRLQEEIEYFYGEDAKRSIRTALCCIQENPVQRPKMSRVVQMLDGVIEPKIPQLSRLPLQPATAASRIKDKLAALADAISQEEGSLDPFDGTKPIAAGSELSFNAWGLSNVAEQNRTILKARNQPCIPPWPLKGDVVMVRGSGKGGEFAHAVIRDVKVRTQQVRLALLRKLQDDRWGVLEEESIWRQWSVMIRTLEFWVPVKWTTLPGFGPQKFPIEWKEDQT